MTWMEWYNSLAKPSWTPAPSTISLIWTILYPVILVSFGFVFVQAFRGKVRLEGGPAVRHQPGRQPAVHADLRRAAERAAGLRDILIVWATIIWCVVVAWPVYRWVAVAQVPYFVWVSTATVIQVSITAMNW